MKRKYQCFGTNKYHTLVRCQECPDLKECGDIERERCDVMEARFRHFEDAIEELQLICPNCKERVKVQGRGLFCSCGGVELAHRWFIGLERELKE